MLTSGDAIHYSFLILKTMNHHFHTAEHVHNSSNDPNHIQKFDLSHCWSEMDVQDVICM